MLDTISLISSIVSSSESSEDGVGVDDGRALVDDGTGVVDDGGAEVDDGSAEVEGCG